MKQYVTLLLLLLFVATTTAGQKQQSSREKEIPNFHQVNPNLYRGGQPKKDGLQQLKQLGVTTIINLRDSDEQAGAEEKVAKSIGLRYFNVPLSNFNRPSDTNVDEILKLIEAQENQPVFVHCKRGSDRTGLIIAIYRMTHDGWNSERAKAEAKEFGLGFWQVKMKDYLSDYERRLQQGNVGSRAAKP